MAAKIQSGDTVMVMSGKNRGARGKVIRVLKDRDRVVVEGVNIVKRHAKPRGMGMPAGIIEKEAPIHMSNVMIYSEKLGKPERTRFEYLSDGRKVRVGVRSGEMYDVGSR